jgi:choice-of-anchor A domain-containing protein
MNTMRATGLVGSGLCLALLLAATPASAALTASELALDEAVINQFNVVTFGDYTTHSETEGRIAVGGNLYGSSNTNVCFNGCAGNTTDSALGATYGSLDVWGNVSGGAKSGGGDFYIRGDNNADSTLNMNYHGGVNIAGSNNGSVESANFLNTGASGAGTTQNFRNNAPIATGQPTTTTFPFAATMPFQGALTDLATSIAADAAATTTQSLAPSGNNAVVTAVAAPGNYDGKTYGFVTTTVADLASQGNLDINTNGLDAVFVVVTGTSGTLPTMNFNEADVIWDFVDATSLTFNGQWSGQILAPDATVTVNGDLNGSIVADEIVQNAEIHQFSNGGDVLPTSTLSGLPTETTNGDQPGTSVPEPPALALLLVGIAGLAVLRRRTAQPARR